MAAHWKGCQPSHCSDIPQHVQREHCMNHANDQNNKKKVTPLKRAMVAWSESVSGSMQPCKGCTTGFENKQTNISTYVYMPRHFQYSRHCKCTQMIHQCCCRLRCHGNCLLRSDTHQYLLDEAKQWDHVNEQNDVCNTPLSWLVHLENDQPWSFWKPTFLKLEIEPFSTAERSERVENFLFRATREYTEAGIEQATVAMRCHGANSPKPRRRTVPWSDTSALRAARQQLYNRTSLTSWAHRGSLSKRRELVLSSLPGLAASHSSKDPPSLAYWLFASP